MINYDEDLKNPTQFNAIILKEMAVIDGFRLSQNSLKNYINTYVEEIKTTFANDEVFKNMLLASLETASLQISINTTDLGNLYNILNIILSQPLSLQENIEQYNTLLLKVEKNINIVKEILQKTINSFEQLSKISNKAATPSVSSTDKLKEAKHAILESEKNIEEKRTVPRNIREISDKTSSDLLCFFPKSDNDILAISTVQNTYKVMFDKNVSTVCIEDDNFNFTLKTSGVQISNSENVLLISREASGYFIITNMPIEVPSYINVSRIDRNKNFIEIGIKNTSLSVEVTKNKILFSDELEKAVSIESQEKTVSVSPSEAEPLPKRLENIQIQQQDIDEIPKESIYSEPQKTGNKDEEDLIKDNDTLIISEEDNQVILPYKLSEVERQYKKNKKKYSSVKDLIENEYIIPTENFKNPVKSRFREAYQLIKKKEHGHLKEALELGFELMFQSNLNPAVIAACKNLKELDIYLDCLDDNELDKFSCFNIVYNVPPSLGKGKGKRK